jgi:hypothetical protein
MDSVTMSSPICKSENEVHAVYSQTHPSMIAIFMGECNESSLRIPIFGELSVTCFGGAAIGPIRLPQLLWHHRLARISQTGFDMDRDIVYK